MVFIEKFEFTYQDYLNYCNSFYCDANEEFLCVKEDSEEYLYEENTGDKKHDKIFKDILQNKEEIAQFISNFAKYTIKPEKLEIQNPNYITQNFKYKQADIVYKIKGEEIYFLVEHQTKVDYSMAYRILNYCVEIIRSVVKGKSINKASFKYPKIIPIVLYTGKQKWTAATSFSATQAGDDNTDIIDVKYRLIDINKFQIEELLRERTMFANIMILEKSKNNEEIINNLIMILRNASKRESRETLKRIIMYLYYEIDEDVKEQIIKIIEESESEENMLTARKIIKAEFKKERREGLAEGIAQGILEGMKQIIERMIKMDLEDEFIKQATGAEQSEIEMIRKEIEMQDKK